jgi:hypothetical protein
VLDFYRNGNLTEFFHVGLIHKPMEKSGDTECLVAVAYLVQAEEEGGVLNNNNPGEGGIISRKVNHHHFCSGEEEEEKKKKEAACSVSYSYCRC